MDYSLLHRDCWLEIDLDRLENNYKAMKNMVGTGIKVMPAVKANGYSHGIIACGQTLQQAGADYLGVGNIDEAVLLRENGITMPLLIFAGNLIEEVADLYIKFNLIPTILNLKEAESISKAASKEHPIFIKIETGRGRLGINAEELPDFYKKVSKLPNIKVEGIYSHMCPVDWPQKKSSDYAQWQYSRFKKALDEIGPEADKIPFRQLANTPASIALPNLRLSGICPGRAMWGFSPIEKLEGHPEINYPMTAWKSRLIHINRVEGGKYGENFATTKLENTRRIGIVVGGVSDGVSTLQSHGEVLIRGKRVPVASSICLEHTIVDLTDCPEAQLGDEVVLFGKQGEEEITMDDLRNFWKKDLMSFWTAITPHVHRVYYKNGKVVAISYGDILKTI